MNEKDAFQAKENLKENFLYPNGKFYKSTHILEEDLSGFASSPSKLVNGVGIGMKGKSEYFIKLYSMGQCRFKRGFFEKAFNINEKEVFIAEVGDITPQNLKTTDLVRPVRPGISIGHYNVSAGTLGAVVSDKGGQLFILSNNHVLADNNAGNFGDAILQPAPHDGGFQGKNEIASLYDFVELLPNGINTLDGSIASLNDDIQVNLQVPQIGRLRGINNPGIGRQVEKIGRTTGYTEGRITARNVDIKVNYGGEMVEFEDQVEIIGAKNGFSKGGDSGSVIVDQRTKQAVGLLFAGSSSGSTFANPIKPVLNTFNVNVV